MGKAVENVYQVIEKTSLEAAKIRFDHWAAVLCGACMFSPYLCRFPLHAQRHDD